MSSSRSCLALALVACAACSDHAPLEPPVPAPTVPLFEEPTAEPPPEVPAEAPVDAPPEPDAARADPLRARVAAEPNDAAARCELGWLYFEVGSLEVAEAEIERGVRTLENDFRLADRRARQTLGACLFDRGRLHEAREERDAALVDYERSLWYRDDAAVRDQWTSLSAVLGRTGARPQSVPAALWTYATAREAEECGPAPARHGAAFGEDSTRGSCAVHIEALARGPDRRIAAVLSMRDYDDSGTPEQSWDDEGTTTYELATSAGTTWTRREDVYATEASEGSGDVVFTVTFEDVVHGGDPEILVEVDDVWHVEHADDDASASRGREGRVLVCGDPDGEAGFLCASVLSRHEYQSLADPSDSVVESCEVRFLGGGDVTIRGRMDGERVRRDTTVAELWTEEIAARAEDEARAAAAEARAAEAAARAAEAHAVATP